MNDRFFPEPVWTGPLELDGVELLATVYEDGSLIFEDGTRYTGADVEAFKARPQIWPVKGGKE